MNTDLKWTATYDANGGYDCITPAYKLITEGSASEVLEYISNNCQRRGNG